MPATKSRCLTPPQAPHDRQRAPHSPFDLLTAPSPIHTQRVDLTRSPSHREWPLFACPVRRRRFPVGASPTRRTLQPEATGAVMEATKWLKPSVWQVTYR